MGLPFGTGKHLGSSRSLATLACWLSGVDPAEPLDDATWGRASVKPSIPGRCSFSKGLSLRGLGVPSASNPPSWTTQRSVEPTMRRPADLAE